MTTAHHMARARNSLSRIIGKMQAGPLREVAQEMLEKLETQGDFLPMPAAVGQVFEDHVDIDEDRDEVIVSLLERADDAAGLEWGFVILHFAFNEDDAFWKTSTHWAHDGFGDRFASAPCSLIHPAYRAAALRAHRLVEDSLAARRETIEEAWAS